MLKFIISTMLLLSWGAVQAQTAEQQKEWARLATLAACEVDTQEHFHIHGFSHKGTNDLIAHYTTSNSELDAENMRGYAKICNAKGTSVQNVAAAVQSLQDGAAKLRGKQIDEIREILDDADFATFQNFRSGSTTTYRTENGDTVIVSETVVETDAAKMVRDGELSADLVVELSCNAIRGETAP